MQQIWIKLLQWQVFMFSSVGWYNLKYSLVLALFLIAAIIEPSGYSYVLPASRCDLQMTDAQRGFIASIPFIGVVITSYPWGYLVDTRGRKRIAVYSSLAAGVFGVLSGFMPELISFIICKFLTALCIAGPASVPYSFIGEILPQKYRDITLSIVNAMQISGSAFVPLIAWAILPLDFRINFGLYEFRPWRLLNIVNAMFFIIAAALMSFGPESPKYLVAQGKHDEAMKVLQTFYAGNKGKSPEDYPVKMLKMPNIDQPQKPGILASLKAQSLPLLMPPYVKWLALNGFLLFGVFAVLNGLSVWVPDILNRVLTGNGEGLTACEVIGQRLNETITDGDCIDTIATSTFIINLVANSSCAVIAIVGSSMVKIFGKKTLIVVVFFLIGTFCVMINIITHDMLFAALLSSFPIMGMTIGPINAFAVEIFPTQLRGMAISLAMMIGRCGSVMGANVAGILLDSLCESTFYLFGGLLILCGVSTFLLPKPKITENRITMSRL
ncbi:synaptic vesicle glycoprotein 2C-like isoform X2 [Pectinophora gossypiella]|uniref:synaptic vesicle glycoprotein 2C-like isoform X2 n=1 Tax=Pectinophora gossypiella TaxID=13191 RepID=UPI00214F2B43|nr:synaptic vesicle glycoprotein 2C-like isoform X2 [Pectinophora gossypiella]